MSTRWKGPIATVTLGAAALLASPVGAAGIVRIEFKDPQSYTDAGWSTVDRELNLRALADHVRGWEARLPDGQRLDIEVLDVDLAGDLNRCWRRPEVRILTGRADWPRMRVRWSLKAGDQLLKGGEERISDVAYLGGVARLRSNDALAYDKRMLDDWLRDRVLNPGADH